MLTKDKIPILMHDDLTGRTINPKDEVRKSISEFTFDEIHQLDAGSWFHPRYANNVRVPRFIDALQFCFENSIWMNIEIKPVPGYERETGEIVAKMTQEFFSSQQKPFLDNQLPLFSSFAFDSLKAAYATAPQFKRGYLIDDFSLVPEWKLQCKEIEAYSLHVNHSLLSPNLVQEIKNEGYGLFCYTVNDVSRAKEILSWGVDSFCTDELELFKDFSW